MAEEPQRDRVEVAMTVTVGRGLKVREASLRRPTKRAVRSSVSEPWEAQSLEAPTELAER